MLWPFIASMETVYYRASTSFVFCNAIVTETMSFPQETAVGVRVMFLQPG
jgi:hypothetical protein